MPRREQARILLLGFLKLIALVAVAGAAGIGVGYGLSELSHDDASTTSGTNTAALSTTPPPVEDTTVPTEPTATTSEPGFELVDVRVLGAVLRPAGVPSGARPQDGRLVMRVRAQNGDSRAVTITPPVLRIGSVSIQLDASADGPGTAFGSLAAGETKAVTVRFALSGDATPKAIRDRRARLEIAGRSQPLRIKIGSQYGS